MAYTAPTISDLRTRFPEFASATAYPDATVQLWLDEAATLTTGWAIEEDRAPAEQAYAAWQMKMNGPVGGDQIGELAVAGVSSFKSGNMSASFDSGAIARASAGGYAANRYGLEWRRYLRRNVGGPRLVGCVYPTRDPYCA